jgi:glucose-6-phosphate-specific signal transduction histidine kinase
MARKWHGVLLTTGGVIIIFLSSRFIPLTGLTLALAFIPLAYTAYHGGLYPGLAAATIITIATIFIEINVIRGLQIAIAAFGIAIPMGLLREKGQMMQNGHLSKITEIRLLARFLLDHRKTMNDGLIFRFLSEIEDRAGNLEAQVALWRNLHQEIAETKAVFAQSQLMQSANTNEEEISH